MRGGWDLSRRVTARCLFIGARRRDHWQHLHQRKAWLHRGIGADGKWSIKDKEAEGYSVVELRLKDPIRGYYPSILVNAVPHSGVLTAEQIMDSMQYNFAQQGVTTGGVETKWICRKESVRVPDSDRAIRARW